MSFDPRYTPKLWFKRLVIFESLHPVTIRRNIVLHRGLNIIMGKSFHDLDVVDNPLVMAGHSVGKTTFCRLLRYCLGETHFSTADGEQVIRASLPFFWVGAELELKGQHWAILRSLGAQKTHSLAQKDIAVDELANSVEESSAGKSVDFSVFCSELYGLLPSTANHPEIQYKWEHLLAWLARDQECRLQEFEVWRDSASGSGSPSFRKKEYATHLIRGMLDLLIPEETSARLTLAELTKQHTELKSQLAEAIKQQNDAEHAAAILYQGARNRLVEIIGDFPDARNPAAPSLFGPDIFANTHRDKLKAEYNSLKEQLEEIKQLLFKEQRAIADAQDQKLKVDAMRAATPPGAPTNAGQEKKDHEEKKEERELLRSRIDAGGECGVIGKTFFLSDCAHLKEYIDYLEQAEHVISLPDEQRKATFDKMEKGQAAKLQTIIEQQEKAKAELDEAISRQQSYEVQRDDIEEKITAIKVQYDRLNRALNDFKNAENQIACNVPDADKPQGLELLEKIENEINEAKQHLADYRHQSAQKDADLRNLFDEIVSRVIKADYYGSVVTSADGFMPQIMRRGRRITGTAYNSFSFVLMDITSMLAPSKGIGHHPGFLLHDSPREADLDISLYHSLFAELAAIVGESGGIDHAPFQYIVTTTTEPPANLNEFVRLELATCPESKMLFRQQLEMPSLLDSG